jgi:hypothetical protein
MEAREAWSRVHQPNRLTQSAGQFGIDLMDEAEAGQRDPRDRLGAALREGLRLAQSRIPDMKR